MINSPQHIFFHDSFARGPRMKHRIKLAIDALVHHDEQLMDMHGEGILDGGYTRASLDQ